MDGEIGPMVGPNAQLPKKEVEMSKKSNWEVFMNGFGVYKNEKTGSVERSWLRTFLEGIGIIGASAGGGYAAGEVMEDQGGFGATIGSLLGSIFAIGRETQIRTSMHGYNKDVEPVKPVEDAQVSFMTKLGEALGLVKKELTLEEKILNALGVGKEEKKEEDVLSKIAAKIRGGSDKSELSSVSKRLGDMEKVLTKLAKAASEKSVD